MDRKRMLKDALLALLDTNRSRPLGSEELMQMLSVDRNTLWTTVRALRSEGYRILALAGKGYRLAEDCEVYSASALAAHLSEQARAMFSLRVVPTLPSTNRTLREMAREGAPTGSVLIAKRQSAGYGRKNRSFFSPTGGIYMSVLLRPELTAQQSLTITTAAAVAVVNAIAEITGRQAQIKWVNDIYLDGKKVCGILTESSLRADGMLDHAVLGIGINVFAPRGGFPKAIRSIATTLYPEGTPTQCQRSALAAAILNHLADTLPICTHPAIHTAYCQASYLPGRTVTVSREDGSEQSAVVYGIDDAYRLLVRFPDGKTDALFSGEVSVHEAAPLP